MSTVTIAGTAYEIEPRYAEGHVLNANEAAALNQTFFENIRNNFAPRAKEGADQSALNDYVASYQFGVRTGGGGARDPIQTEAMSMARDAIRDAIKKSGKNISEYTQKSITEAASKLLERDPKYLELAKKRVEELQNAATSAVQDDLLAGLEAAPAATEGEAAQAEGSAKPKAKAKAE